MVLMTLKLAKEVLAMNCWRAYQLMPKSEANIYGTGFVYQGRLISWSGMIKKWSEPWAHKIDSVRDC